jgi:hypothetical protein
MADEPTVDSAGVARTSDGQIADAMTPPPPQPAPTSSKDSSLLNQTEGKTDGETKGEGETKTEPAKAPEAYEDYKVPEGFTLDPEVKKEADGLFKGMNLSQEQAQSLVDFYVAKARESAEQPYKTYQEMTTKWRDDALAHPDLAGKLGPGKEVTVRIAKALDGLGDAKLASDFRELMDMTGAGNHPAFIRAIDKWAQRMTEGTHVAGNGPSPPGQARPGAPPPSAASAMWPNLPSSRGG